VGHRGGSLEAPENTVAAVRHSIAAGADWVEIDVRRSIDGEPVVMHDDTLERTTNGSGRVSARAWREIRDLRVGPEPVPHLDDVLRLADIRVMIELKADASPAALVRAVLLSIDRAGARERVAIASFDKDVLWRAHDLAPDLPLFGIASTRAAATAMLELPIQTLCVEQSLLPDLPPLPPAVSLWAWTVRDVASAQALLADGVHGIITDVPAAVIKALNEPPSLYIERVDPGALRIN
jgi:glycerophosphoryl diester phosphodiesterase